MGELQKSLLTLFYLITGTFKYGDALNKNPINEDEKNRQVQEPKRVEPELESDDFSPEEQKKIIRMVCDDAEAGKLAMADWKEKKRKDKQHLNSEKPSIIEGLVKKAWMSDRNLGMAAGISDIYQATLYATCWNPDSIHFRATEKNDVDNRDNSEKFMKWVVGSAEANLDSEVDDFIHNRVNLGFSVMKIFWEVYYEWIDKRIPIPSKDGSRRIIGYKIKTEKRRFERGRMVNIDELDDILIPEYGKNVQDLKFFIETLHITYNDLEDFSDRGVIKNFDGNENKFLGVQSNNTDKLRKSDSEALGSQNDKSVTQDVESEKRNVPVDVYEWYGWFKKGGKRERYRFWVEPTSEIFLSGKPLRKINRAGKYPYVGGPLRRIPGFLRGGSLITLIAPAINALNNVFNQITDFQYQENCPDGWYDENDETLKGGMHDREPGKLNPVDGDPNKKIFIPNNSRSMAWAYQYIEFLLQIVERLTGAASYFLTSNAKDTTATRDNIVEEKGQVKFGLWVKRIQQDISEGLNMLFSMYQDWAPSNLATRVIGEDGKAIIKNLSINSIHGNLDCYIVPDITSGSKAYEKQVSMFAVESAQAGCVWVDPRINPRGNWLIWKDAFKKQGIQNPEQFMPPQPKENLDYSKEAEAHFAQLMQGDKPEPPPAESPEIVPCLTTFLRLKETRYQDLDEEYRQNFDDYLFKAYVNYGKFMKQVSMEHMQMQIAAKAAGNLEQMGVRPGAPPPPQQPARNGNAAPIVGAATGFGVNE